MMKKIPMRMCISCQQMYPKKELIRIVKKAGDIDNTIIIDKTGKISGKGAYVCKSNECIKSVIKGNKLEKYLGGKIPDEIYKELEELLT